MSQLLKNNRNGLTLLQEKSVRDTSNNWKYFHSFIPNTRQECQACLGSDGICGDEVELAAISEVCKVAIQVLDKNNSSVQRLRSNSCRT